MKISRHIRFAVSTILVVLGFFVFAQAGFARVMTSAVPMPRVTKKVDKSKRTVLYGHVPHVLTHSADVGRLDPSTKAEHLILSLKPSEEQRREARRVLDEQQDKRTGNYHQWLTPEEYGQHFGVHDSDIETIKAWLASEGLTVESVNKSKRALRFSGTIGQLEHAFQTEMHYFVTPNGETHVSNDREISVPEALSPVIAGVPTLHDFFRKPHKVDVGRYSQMRPGPKYTSSSTVHYVAPADFATIYNTAPLLANGINGTGVTIGIVGRSDILMSDVQTYRQMFNLPVNDPIFIHAGQDNGIEPGDDGESDLDVEISGGVAPNATVKFVIGTPTFLVDGITNSIEYLVENNLTDIISLSYGSCEEVEGAGGNSFNAQMWEQAAAQGMSVFVAAGDNGPAGCDLQGSQTYEVLGYATGGEESTWYSVAVGGTVFYGDVASPTTYWSATNNSTYLSSALTYIPEYPWNESRVASPIPSGDTGSDLWSGSGGISAYYLQPSWQRGPGINNSADPALTLGNGATGLWVTSINLTNPGSGYTSAPTVTFAGGGCTAEPAATSIISGGQVTGITFTGYSSHFEGFGCTSAPTVAFSAAPAGGTTATATANVGQMQYPQPLISGVPHRLTPDLSLNAASGHDATFFCSEGVCELNQSGGLVDAGLVGGTSVAAPSMAGIQALIDQANGGRQGMPGYIYYTLAANQNTANCNSSGPPALGSNCAFQDTTLGNNLICGLSGSSCTAALTQAKIGFNAATGYDMATGLGSPNAYNLATQWSSVVFNSSNTTLNLSQTTFQHGTPITLSGTVAPGSGSGTPTGDVAFIVSQGAISDPVNQYGDGSLNGPAAFATLSGGTYTASLNDLPGGTYNVTARYGGDSTYGSSLSTSTQVTVSTEGSTVTITPYALNGTACTITTGNSFPYSSDIMVEVSVAGQSGAGAPTGTVVLNLDGNPVGTLTLDPNGNAYALSGQIPNSSCIYDYMFSNVTSFPGGGHTLTATYAGDQTYQAGSATAVPITVTQVTPTLTLAAGATLITSGFSDTLTATFGGLTGLTGNSTSNSGPTGTVTFTDTTTAQVLGTASVISTVLFSGNIYTYSAYATLTTAGITTTGANAITATYNGDANWLGVSSAAVTVTVGTGTATTTTVTLNVNPTTLNGRPTFTATVTGAPTAGTATFYDGAVVLGTGTVGSGHTATFRLASGAAFWGGTHNITAMFGGNATFMASTSPVLVETVTQGTVTHNLTCKTVGTSGQNYTCTDVLTPSSTNATYAPNQSVVNFFDGATNIGSAQPITVTSGQGGYGLWAASISVNSLSVGTHTITASYGDINYATSTSSSQTVYVGNTSAGIYSPLPGTTLPNTGTTTTFRWYPVAGGPAISYWLDIGSTQGGNQYYQSGNLGSVLSQAVNNGLLPTNGSTVWARQWTLINGTWTYTDAQYTAFSAVPAGITSPTPGSTFAGSSATFQWNAAAGAQAYWIDVGSTAGGNQYFQSGSLGTGILQKQVNTLPTNGSTVYVTLYTEISGTWYNNAYTYTAFNAAAAAGVLTTPTPGSTLTSGTVTFIWTAGAGATAYWLDAGNTPGGNQYYQSGNLGNMLTTTVLTLPTDGSTIYVTLYSYGGNSWISNAYTYTALNGSSGLAQITSPIPGTTINGTQATFNWNSDPNATAYWLDISNIGPGGNDLDQSGNLGLTQTYTVYNLPDNGSTIYTTLYSLVGGQWLSTSATYTSGPNGPITKKPQGPRGGKQK